MTDLLLALILIVLIEKFWPSPPGWWSGLLSWSVWRFALLTWLALGALGLGAVCALGGWWSAAGVCLVVFVGACALRDWLEARSRL